MASFSFIEFPPNAVWDIIKTTAYLMWLTLKIIWPFLLFIIAIKLFFNWLDKSGKIKPSLPYRKRELMTNPEREFFKVLEKVVGGRYYIIPQVQLSKLVEPTSRKYIYKNKINLKSVDFVLFDKEYFTPHLVIELDDSSHLREDRRARDKFVDEVLNKVGIKILHIKTSHYYNLNDVLNLLV